MIGTSLRCIRRKREGRTMFVKHFTLRRHTIPMRGK